MAGRPTFTPRVTASVEGWLPTRIFAASPRLTGTVAMKSSIEIVLRGIPQSAELERCIKDEARNLDRICDRVLTCRVVIQAFHRPKQKGATLAVGLAITLPGTEVVVNREHGDDVRTAVRDAFEAAGLQLADHMRRQGGDAPLPRGPSPRKSSEH